MLKSKDLLDRSLDVPEGDLGPVRFSADEFLRMCDLGLFDDRKVELVDGRIVEVGLPGSTHARVQAMLIYLLTTALQGSDAVVYGEIGVRLDANTLRALDVAVAHDVGNVRLLAPERVLLAVEIADTTLERDLVVKALEYAQAGIPEYWVLDVNARTTQIMRAAGPFGYTERTPARFDQPLSVPGTERTITLG